MIFIFFALVIGLSIFDIWGLKKKGQAKDIVIYSASMVLVAILGALYLSNNFRPSFVSYLLKLFNLKG